MLPIAGGFVDIGRRRVQRDGRLMSLTAMESRLLTLLAARTPEPVARVDLLTEVWGYRPAVETRTVENTVRRLRTKLERDPSTPAHLQTERGLGYRFIPAEVAPPSWPTGQVTLAWLSAGLPLEASDFEEATETLAETVAAKVGQRGSMLFDAQGSAWGIAFEAEGGALSWAVDLQRALLDAPWPVALDAAPATRRVESVEGRLLWRGPRVSVGLACTNSGVPPEYAGTALQRARQLAEAAQPGEILLSEECWQQVISSAPEDLQAAVRPARRLAADPRPTFVACPRELVERLAPDSPDSGAAPVANRLIGREALQSAALGLLRPGCFVTLVGPPGVGKTALAASASAGIGPQFTRVTWIALSHCRTAAELRSGLAAGLGLTEMSSIRALLHGTDSLCILDNLEQLDSDARAALDQILDGPEAPAVLATSRIALGLPGEVCVPVPALGARDARRLFVQRAEGIRPGFARSDEDLRAVRQIAERLEGLPLAMEIAAARIRVLSPKQLAERLLEGGGAVDLHAAVAWSWDLLAEEERRALTGLTVFQGPFDPESAEAVLVAGSSEPLDVLEALAAHNLLRVMQGDPVHFTPYVMVSDFAATHPEMVDVRAAAELRHAEWAIASCEEAWARRDGAGWLMRHRAELLTAVDRVTESDPVLAARGLLALQGGVGRLDSSVGALVDRLQRVLKSPNLDSSLRAKVLLALGRALTLGGDLDAASAVLDKALAIGADDPLAQLDYLIGHANMLWKLGRHSEADAVLCDLRDRVDPTAQPIYAARIWVTTASVCIAMGRHRDAAAAAIKGEGLARQAGDPWLEAKALDLEGMGLTNVGDHRQGRARLERALALLERHDFAGLRPTTLNNLGNACQRLGDHDAAQRHYVRAIRERDAQGAPMLAAQLRANLGTLQWQRGRNDAALALFDAAVGVLRNCGDTYQLPMLHLNRAGVYQELGQVEPAISDYVEAARLVRQNAQLSAYILANRSGLHHELGELDEAERGYAEALSILRGVGDTYAVTLVGARLAALRAAETGEPEPRAELEAFCAELLASVDEDLACAAVLWRAVADVGAEKVHPEIEPCGPESRLASRILLAGFARG